MTDPKAQVYRFTYNAVGWPTAEFDPVNRADSLFYSLDGEIRRWKNRRNQAITFTYDVLHRPLATNATGLADTLSYPDAAGLSVVAKNALSTVTQYLNVRGQPDSVTTVLNGRTYKQRYAYRPNSPGLLDSTWATASSGSASFLNRRYMYNTARGTLDSIRLALQGWTTFTYDSELLPSQTKLPNGDVLQFTFQTPLNHLLGTMYSAAPHAAITNWTASYDSLARVRYKNARLDTLHAFYRYDNRGRIAADSFLTLKAAYCPDPFDPMSCLPEAYYLDSAHTYTYDQAGNRTDWSGTYTTGNRITNFRSCTYATNNDGNVTRRTCGAAVDSLWWGPTNRLDSIKVGSAKTRFGYDALGRLVRKDKNGTIRYFVWDGANLLAELDAAGAEIGEYSYYPGLDNLHAFIVGSTAYYPHEDALGNIIALSNSSKQWRRSYVYESFGRSAGGTDLQAFNGTDRARFKGALYLGEEADLYYMRNRWYEARSGRFLSEDPIGLAGGINTYAFAGNDPANGADPLGLEPCEKAEDGVYECPGVTVDGPAPTTTTYVLPCYFCGGRSFGGGPPGGGFGGDSDLSEMLADTPRSCFLERLLVAANVALDASTVLGVGSGAVLVVKGSVRAFQGFVVREVFDPHNVRMLFQVAGRQNVLRAHSALGTGDLMGGLAEAGVGAGGAALSYHNAVSTNGPAGGDSLVDFFFGTPRALRNLRACREQQ